MLEQHPDVRKEFAQLVMGSPNLGPVVGLLLVKDPNLGKSVNDIVDTLPDDIKESWNKWIGVDLKDAALPQQGSIRNEGYQKLREMIMAYIQSDPDRAKKFQDMLAKATPELKAQVNDFLDLNKQLPLSEDGSPAQPENPANKLAKAPTGKEVLENIAKVLGNAVEVIPNVKDVGSTLTNLLNTLPEPVMNIVGDYSMLKLYGILGYFQTQFSTEKPVGKVYQFDAQNNDELIKNGISAASDIVLQTIDNIKTLNSKYSTRHRFTTDPEKLTEIFFKTHSVEDTHEMKMIMKTAQFLNIWNKAKKHLNKPQWRKWLKDNAVNLMNTFEREIGEVKGQGEADYNHVRKEFKKIIKEITQAERDYRPSSLEAPKKQKKARTDFDDPLIFKSKWAKLTSFCRIRAGTLQQTRTLSQIDFENGDYKTIKKQFDDQMTLCKTLSDKGQLDKLKLTLRDVYVGLSRVQKSGFFEKNPSNRLTALECSNP